MVFPDRPTGTKEVRAQPFASQCGIQNVVLVAGDWNAPYIEELAMFPNGGHDDQVDASCGAFSRLVHFPVKFEAPTSFTLPSDPIRYGVQLDRSGRRSTWFNPGRN